jgi:hypothetical protein
MVVASYVALVLAGLLQYGPPCSPGPKPLRASGFEVVIRCAVLNDGALVEIAFERLQAKRTSARVESLEMGVIGRVVTIDAPTGWVAETVAKADGAAIRWRPERGRASIRVVNRLRGFRVTLAGAGAGLGCPLALRLDGGGATTACGLP